MVYCTQSHEPTLKISAAWARNPALTQIRLAGITGETSRSQQRRPALWDVFRSVTPTYRDTWYGYCENISWVMHQSVYTFNVQTAFQQSHLPGTKWNPDWPGIAGIILIRCWFCLYTNNEHITHDPYIMQYDKSLNTTGKKQNMIFSCGINSAYVSQWTQSMKLLRKSLTLSLNAR